MKYILVCFILLSCSLFQKRPSDTDLGWIDDKDFNRPSQIKYNSSRDLFSKTAKDSLSRESLARIPQSVIGSKVKNQETDQTSYLLGLCHRKKFKKAFAFVKKEYRKYEKHPAFWNAVGNCYVLQGDMKKSILFYRKSNEIDPSYAPAKNNIGVIYQREGKVKQAYDTYVEALKVNNFLSTPLFNMAQLDLKHGLADKALNSFLALHKKDSEDIDVLNALGTIYLLKGNLKESLKYYGKIDHKSYRRDYIGINLALALHLGKNHKKAGKLIDNVSINEKSPMFGYFNRVKRFIKESR